MFQIRKSFSFEASHQLRHHAGKCARVHGHSYRVELLLERERLVEEGPATNMVVDFGVVSAVMRKLIGAFFDHHHLNDSLQSDSPTAEFIAQWIYHRVVDQLPFLVSVTVHETATASATYGLVPPARYVSPRLLLQTAENGACNARKIHHGVGAQNGHKVAQKSAEVLAEVCDGGRR